MHTETGTRLSKTRTQLLPRQLKWFLGDKMSGLCVVGWTAEVITDLIVCRQEVGKWSVWSCTRPHWDIGLAY